MDKGLQRRIYYPVKGKGKVYYGQGTPEEDLLPLLKVKVKFIMDRGPQRRIYYHC